MLLSRRRAALVGLAVALAVPMTMTASAANAATIHRYCDTSVYCTIIHSTSVRKTITIKVASAAPARRVRR
jgi:recombination DNA repair RAD52 pathway protein